jgi:hypothetical protein
MAEEPPRNPRSENSENPPEMTRDENVLIQSILSVWRKAGKYR